MTEQPTRFGQASFDEGENLGCSGTSRRQRAVPGGSRFRSSRITKILDVDDPQFTGGIGSLDDLGLEIGQDAGQGAVKDRPLIGAVGEQLLARERETDRTRSPAARDRRRDPERRRR